MLKQHVVVAMSGGVDSSITAHLLKKSGYDVSGIHLELSPALKKLDSELDHEDLEQSCKQLNIPLYYLHVENDFEDQVIEYFCEEYNRGRTPNPCIQCNKNIKFGRLLEKVRDMGGDYLATGHYARVERGERGYRLLKGVDPGKDQSYFLYVLGQNELVRVLFPVGGLHKTEVKKLAAELGLASAIRKESQDICFIPDGDYHAFVAAHVTPRPGEIVDTEGKVLGSHEGLAYYTVGQRQGMGVSSHERLYVVRLEAETNRLVIGPQSKLYKKMLVAHDLNWTSGIVPESEVQITVKMRYRSPEAAAALHVMGDSAEVHFVEPQKSIALGQSVVFYQGEEVMGGGIIAENA